MGHGFKHGGSLGASLNFAVVGNPKPNNPKENTIWLNTDVEITSWVFSAEEPENLAHGDVWIPIGVSGAVTLNALKKNGILLHPLEAKQYINGALVKKDAAIYQDNHWVEWVMWLFSNGDIKNITGGWTVTTGKNGAYPAEATPSLTVNEDSLVIRTNEGMGFAHPKNPIDLTPYTTVHYTGTASDNSGYTSKGGCCPVIMPTDSNDVQKALAKKDLPAFGNFNDLQVDVTNVNKAAYVGWWMYDYGNASMNATAVLRQIWIT
jgi:hypothetical protein